MLRDSNSGASSPRSAMRLVTTQSKAYSNVPHNHIARCHTTLQNETKVRNSAQNTDQMLRTLSSRQNVVNARLYRWRRLPVLEILPKLLMLSRLLMLDRLPYDETDDMLDTLSLLLLRRRRRCPPAPSNVRF